MLNRDKVIGQIARWDGELAGDGHRLLVPFLKLLKLDGPLKFSTIDTLALFFPHYSVQKIFSSVRWGAILEMTKIRFK